MRTGRHRWRWAIAVWLACGLWASAADVDRLQVDGVVYENVRWGPVKDGKVTVFHTRGITTVPLSKLPEAYADQLGYRPPPAAAASGEAGTAPSDPFFPEPGSPPPPRPAPPKGPVDSTYARIQVARANTEYGVVQAEYERYRQDCTRLAVYQGQIVEKSTLTELIGLVRGKGSIEEDKVTTPGFLVELAKPKENIDKIPPLMRARPGLWQGTGTQVFLREYTTAAEAGRPLRVWGKDGEPVKGYRTFHVARELTIEQWRQQQAATTKSAAP